MDGRIWPWFDGEYRVHCKTRAIYNEIMSWTGSRHGSTYTYPDKHKKWDVTIAANMLKRAQALLRQQSKSQPAKDHFRPPCPTTI
jgi:hypothetical protein